MKPKLTCTLWALIILGANANLAAQECDLPSKATYTISNNISHSNTQLELYRSNNKVAHYYPDTEITEYWELNTKRQIKPTRFFNAFERGIEYQPNEVVHGKVEKDWSYRFQLVSQRFIDNTQLVSYKNSGCDLIQTLHAHANNLHYVISYFPARQLVKEFLIKDKKTEKVIEHWHLVNASDNKDLAEQVFARIATFQTTDFADIGDDHSDPFLTKMVALGFIESGASGYYHAFKENKVEPMGQHVH